MKVVMEERKLWIFFKRRVQAKALHQCDGPSDDQEEVEQGAGGHVSRYGRLPSLFRSSIGTYNEWSRMEGHYDELSLSLSTLLHDDVA